jgi:hypothetical protein
VNSDKEQPSSLSRATAGRFAHASFHIHRAVQLRCSPGKFRGGEAGGRASVVPSACVLGGSDVPRDA